jgi:putative tricarboxylic transport membrane protein
MSLFEGMISGFAVSLQWSNLLYAFLGVSLGTAVGVLPGLGTVATVAILLPLTYHIEAVSAIIMLAGIFYGAMYGGSTTSILLNIPGEAASVVTCIDGYQMARQGRAGPALGIAAIGSFFAGTISILGVSLLAPYLANFALELGPTEYFAMVLMGLTMAIYLSEEAIAKGLLMGAFGLFLGTVGQDPVSGTERFTFGLARLMEGVDFVVVAMGVFGISEVLINLKQTEVRDVFQTSLKGLLPSLDDWKRSWGPILRGSILGFFIGVIPGGGATISSFASYAVEKRISKHPELLGKGAIEGVAGPEATNNAASTSSFIPLLTLGIPGNATIAMILIAFMIHGIRPGPMMLTEHPDLFWGVVTSMYIGNVMLLALNLPLIQIWVRMLKVPYPFLAVSVLIVCIIGSFSLRNAIFDIGAMIVFGVFGFFVRERGYPPAPLMLAMILGPILELSLQQSLIASDGDLLVFFKHPISAAMLFIAGLLVLKPLISWFKKLNLKSKAMR